MIEELELGFSYSSYIYLIQEIFLSNLGYLHLLTEGHSRRRRVVGKYLRSASAREIPRFCLVVIFSFKRVETLGLDWKSLGLPSTAFAFLQDRQTTLCIVRTCVMVCRGMSTCYRNNPQNALLTV